MLPCIMLMLPCAQKKTKQKTRNYEGCKSITQSRLTPALHLFRVREQRYHSAIEAASSAKLPHM